MLKKIIILSVSFLLISCSKTVKTKLGLRAEGPDSKTVAERDHLKIPPIILTELPEPEDSK